MRFIVDECTGPNVANWISDNGYEVYSVYVQNRGMKDEDILEKANIENWIIITNDKGFGEMIFKNKKLHKGVILLRLRNERAKSKIKCLENLFKNYLNDLEKNFTVVTETSVRIKSM